MICMTYQVALRPADAAMLLQWVQMVSVHYVFAVQLHRLHEAHKANIDYVFALAAWCMQSMMLVSNMP